MFAPSPETPRHRIDSPAVHPDPRVLAEVFNDHAVVEAPRRDPERPQVDPVLAARRPRVEPHDRVVTELAGEHEAVGACPSREQVVAPAAPQVVAAGAAGQLVIAPPALEPVLAPAAVQPVAAVAPSQPVVTEFAAKLVAAGKAEQPVVAAPAIDLVVQGAARQALGPGAAEKHQTLDRSRLEGAQIRGGIARQVALVPRRGLPAFAPPSAGLNASGFRAIVRVGPPLSASLPARTPSTIATVASKTFPAVVLPISDMPEKTSVPTILPPVRACGPKISSAPALPALLPSTMLFVRRTR